MKYIPEMFLQAKFIVVRVYFLRFQDLARVIIANITSTTAESS